MSLQVILVVLWPFSSHVELLTSVSFPGLQWAAIKAREYSPVEQSGVRVVFNSPDLADKAKREIEWSFDSLSSTSACCSVVVFHKDRCIAHYGQASGEEGHGASSMGPMCRDALAREGKGTYIPNLAVYPGRVEFTYLPDTIQSMVLQPIGDEGLLIVCGDTQRGFTKLDQAWVATLAEKLDVTLGDPASTSSLSSMP